LDSRSQSAPQRRYGATVSTRPFQGRNTGSIPVSATIILEPKPYKENSRREGITVTASVTTCARKMGKVSIIQNESRIRNTRSPHAGRPLRSRQISFSSRTQSCTESSRGGTSDRRMPSFCESHLAVLPPRKLKHSHCRSEGSSSVRLVNLSNHPQRAHRQCNCTNFHSSWI
jgi:hypothetical protein